MNVAVIGAGAWGTAFALHLARKGASVLLWTYEPELAEILSATRENSYYLSGFALPGSIRFTASLGAAVDFSEDVVVATPSFALRGTLEQAAAKLVRKNILVLAKGIERESLLPMSTVVEEATGGKNRVAILSGPSFAKEVAAGVFTSVVVASRTRDTALYFQSLCHSDDFRVYTTDDLTGVELGGAMKNVMAIGAGVLEGLGLGSNSHAAFVTRALAEIKRLGKSLGARETTFMGLSGMGDLILTCYGLLSRNRRFGLDLARGLRAREIIGAQKEVVEGYYTVEAAWRLARRLGIEMPITDELYRIIYESKPLSASINDLKQREFKEEES